MCLHEKIRYERRRSRALSNSSIRGFRTPFHFSIPKKTRRSTFSRCSLQKSLPSAPPSPSLVATQRHSVGRMFSVQQQLPRLPVPPLQQTLEKYLKAVEPILSDEDYTKAEELVSDFGRPGGIGRKLQEMLEDRQKSTVNWLEDWWLNTAYLEYRLPCAIHVNPGVMFPEQKFNSEEEYLRYAARMVSGVLDYKSQIDDLSLPVEKLGGQSLCMKQFYAILSSCRIPGKKHDSVITYSPDKPDPPRHMVVVHNNYFFAVDLYGSTGQPLGTKQIHEILKKVVDQSKTPGNPLGILTSDNRNTWGKVYHKLVKDHGNRASVDKIQRSIFLLCLDQSYGTVEGSDRRSTIAAGLDHGLGSHLNAGNRWYDKTLQFIVSRDGAVGLNYEHAPAEGPPIISVVDHTLDFVEKGIDMPAADGVKEPYKLEFKFHPDISEAIDLASEAIDATISDLDMHAFAFDHFGKNFIKSQKVSPDAFIQVGIQLAYHRIYQRSVATYESGSLRRFQHGRTETIRSCSVASDTYCKAMLNSKTSDEEKEKLLREAIGAHRKYTDEVINGQGIDRHLLGLKLSAIENGLDVPPFFMDPIYAQSVHWQISTSQVPSKHNATLVFAPVVPDGYGLCYNPMPDSINMCISAWNSSPETDSKRLAEAVNKAFLDGAEALKHSSSTKSKL